MVARTAEKVDLYPFETKSTKTMLYFLTEVCIYGSSSSSSSRIPVLQSGHLVAHLGYKHKRKLLAQVLSIPVHVIKYSEYVYHCLKNPFIFSWKEMENIKNMIINKIIVNKNVKWVTRVMTTKEQVPKLNNNEMSCYKY